MADASFPANSIADLISLARQQPNRYFYGTSGVGTRPPHIWIERFKRLAGVEISHVPYNGSGPLVKALLSGDIPLGMEGVPPLLPHVRSGKLKAIAVTGNRRLVALPGTPTEESRYPGIGMTWVAAIAPARIPEAAVARLNEEFVRAITRPDVKAVQEEAGRTVIASSPEFLASAVRRELPKWASVIREAHIKPE